MDKSLGIIQFLSVFSLIMFLLKNFSVTKFSATFLVFFISKFCLFCFISEDRKKNVEVNKAQLTLSPSRKIIRG